MAARRQEHLFSRPGQSFGGTGHSGYLVDLLSSRALLGFWRAPARKRFLRHSPCPLDGKRFLTCWRDRKSTRLNSSHGYISYAVFCLKKKNKRLAHTEHVHYVAILHDV